MVAKSSSIHYLNVIMCCSILYGIFTIIGYLFDKTRDRQIWLSETTISFSVTLVTVLVKYLFNICNYGRYYKVSTSIPV